jgi:hypothetical protein
MPEMLNGAAFPMGPGVALTEDGLLRPKEKPRQRRYASQIWLAGPGFGQGGCGFKPKNGLAAMHFGLFSLSQGWLCSVCFYGRDLVDGGLRESSNKSAGMSHGGQF